MQWHIGMLVLLILVGGCRGSTSSEANDAATVSASPPATLDSATLTARVMSIGLETAPPSTQRQVLDILASDERFSIFHEIVSAGLPYFIEFMSMTDWNHTVFVPTDAAFDALPVAAVDAMRTGQVSVVMFLDHLTLPIVMPVADLKSGSYDTVGQGGPALEITVADDGITLDGTAAVIDADIEGSNGIIHAIDTVIGVDYILRGFD